MIVPKFLKEGDLVIISSPSNGLKKEEKIKLLDEAKKLFNMQKINVIEDKYTRTSDKGESSNAQNRANELEKIIQDKKIDMVLSVTGGDYLIELLDKVNLDFIKDNVKWFQGQSDATILLYLITTKYDIQTIYSFNAASLSKANEVEIFNNFEILKGKKISQKDFNYDINLNGEFQNNGWRFKEKIDVTGRIIGGYIGCLIDLLGTKYDYTKNFIDKYKEDGIIWYFDIDYITNEELLRQIWHLKNAGWFEYTKCIIFGRSEEKNYTGITLDEAISRGLDECKIPYITNFDLGHTNPRVTIVNGSKVNLVCNDKKRVIDIIE